MPLCQREIATFYNFIEMVYSPPMPVLPQSDLAHSIDTDARNYVIGVTLFQTNTRRTLKSIGYWLRLVPVTETTTIPRSNVNALPYCEKLNVTHIYPL